MVAKFLSSSCSTFLISSKEILMNEIDLGDLINTSVIFLLKQKLYFNFALTDFNMIDGGDATELCLNDVR